MIQRVKKKKRRYVTETNKTKQKNGVEKVNVARKKKKETNS
jgi:hypothetical protein